RLDGRDVRRAHPPATVFATGVERAHATTRVQAQLLECAAIGSVLQDVLVGRRERAGLYPGSERARRIPRGEPLRYSRLGPRFWIEESERKPAATARKRGRSAQAEVVRRAQVVVCVRARALVERPMAHAAVTRIARSREQLQLEGAGDDLRRCEI